MIDERTKNASELSGWAAITHTWTRPALWLNVAIVAAPSVVFLLGNAITGLVPAIITAGITAVAGLVLRLARREKIRGALIGLILVAACAVTAIATGEARGFFLIPTLIPFAMIAACLVTIIARRPLTGLLLNRITGGPTQWWTDRGVARVHYAATTIAIGINIVNATLQVMFYANNDTVVLAVAHAATGPVFAALVAATIVAARRALARR